VGDAPALWQPGRYTALALYCFSPAVLRACIAPNAEVLAALGFMRRLHLHPAWPIAMQGPKRKWRPRIVLLTAAFGLAAAAHIAALPVVALIGLVAMLWVAEGRRSRLLPVVLVAVAGANGGWSSLLRLLAGSFQLRFRSARGLSVGFT